MSDLTDRQIRTDITMSVAARDGEVHLLFNEEDRQTKQPRAAYTANFLMSANDALAFSTLVADLAFEAETGLKAAGSAIKAELIDRHRATLTRRIELMMNSQREKKKLSNAQLARQVVEVCMSEVFS